MRSSPLRHPAHAAGTSLLRMQSDERLTELARAGHEAAFDAIVVRHRAALTRYCAGIVGQSRADDAVQQTLINAHDALPKVEDVRHLRSWLYRIAHNVSLNLLRGLRDDVSLEDATASPALTSDGPAARFERSEQFQATVAALQALPERQRAALVLRELEGRSHEEIADALGVSKGSARQHLMRARVAMRGAVTAITPYPLVVRLADLLSGSGGGAAPWGDAVAGGASVGIGAGLMKATAGIVATGALVGGAAVGTDRVVRHGSGEDAAPARAAELGVKRTAKAAPARKVPAATATATATTTTASPRVRRASATPTGTKDRKTPARARKPKRHAPAAAAPTPAATKDIKKSPKPKAATQTSHPGQGNGGKKVKREKQPSGPKENKGSQGKNNGSGKTKVKDNGKAKTKTKGDAGAVVPPPAVTTPPAAAKPKPNGKGHSGGSGDDG